MHRSFFFVICCHLVVLGVCSIISFFLKFHKNWSFKTLFQIKKLETRWCRRTIEMKIKKKKKVNKSRQQETTMETVWRQFGWWLPQRPACDPYPRIRHRERNTMLCANWSPWRRRFCSSSRDERTVSSPQWHCSVSQLWPLTPDQPRPQRRGCREHSLLWFFFHPSQRRRHNAVVSPSPADDPVAAKYRGLHTPISLSLIGQLSAVGVK